MLAVKYWFALVMALMAIPVVSAANIFLQDLREDLEAPPPALQSTGMLRTVDDPESWGTALLVGQCHILTAFHVAFPKHKSPGFSPSPAFVSVFHVGKQAGMRRDEFSESSRARPVAWGDFHTRDFSGLAGDWAILRLDNCLGQHYGWVRLAEPFGADSIVTSGTVSMASFPSDRSGNRGISFESNCRIRSIIASRLGAMDCALIEGASGAPVLEKSEGEFRAGGLYSLVGIAIRRFNPVDEVLPEYSVQHANILVMNQAFAAAVKRHTEEASLDQPPLNDVP